MFSDLIIPSFKSNILVYKKLTFENLKKAIKTEMK